MNRAINKVWMIMVIGILGLLLMPAAAWARATDPDLNNDGTVNILDVSMVGSCYGQDPASLPQCQVADTDGDGDVDFDDLNYVTGSFGQSGFPVGEQQDKTAPVVTITAPEPLSFFNSSSISVAGKVSEDATVTVNGVPATLESRTWTATISLHEGNNTITAVAEDAAGNVGTASFQVTLDTQPPRVTIDSPPEGFITNDSLITVAGMINDIVVGTVNGGQAQVKVNGIAAEVANRSFLAPDVPLSPGPNTITAIGTDKAGNIAKTIITVKFEEIIDQPRILSISGNNQTGPIGAQLPEPLAVTLTDGNGDPVPGETVIFKVTENNGSLSNSPDNVRALAVTTDAQGRAIVRWTLGKRSGAGNNKVEAKAVGFVGKAIFTATALPAAPDKINVDAGNNQTGVAGQPLARPLVSVITDAGHNRLADVPIVFAVTEGEGTFDGQSTITVKTDSDGRALAVLTLGPEEGTDNNVVQATFPNNPGFPAIFVASGKVAGDPAATTITGVVLDNTDRPIPGVTMRIKDTGLTTQIDEQGQFVLQPAPVGHVVLIADGNTAERPGTWPRLEYDLVTVAGQKNTIGMPIYLLPLDLPNGLFVNEATGGTLTLPHVPGFSLTIEPGSATFPDGSTSGLVSVTVVHADKVPMTPNFGQQPRFIVTIQPAGVHFDPPASITLPNVDGLAPGEVTEMYSFDHDLGQFVAIGTGTVSEDGTIIRSDPGVGIIKGGWHCGGNPQTTGGAENANVVIDSRCSSECVLLEAGTPIFLFKDDRTTLQAEGGPLPGIFTWTTSDPQIVVLEGFTQAGSGGRSDGLIFAKEQGTATITVQFVCRSGALATDSVDVEVLGDKSLIVFDKNNVNLRRIDPSNVIPLPDPVLYVPQTDALNAFVVVRAAFKEEDIDSTRPLTWNVQGNRVEPPSGLFTTPASSDEVTLTPTGGNREFQVLLGFDENRDGTVQAGEKEREIKVRVVNLDRLEVSSMVDGLPLSAFTLDGATRDDLFLAQPREGELELTLGATVLPAEAGARRHVLWAVRGANGERVASGSFANAEEPKAALPDRTGEFVAEAGFDRDADGKLDTEEAEHKIVVHVALIDIVGHQPGLERQPRAEAEISEVDEDDPSNLVLLVNDDEDDGGSDADNADDTVGANDDDVAVVTLKSPGVLKGTMRLIFSPDVQLIGPETSGLRESPGVSVDLEAPDGPLGGLAAGDMSLLLEGNRTFNDVRITLFYEDLDGRDVAKDSLHVAVVKADLDILKPDGSEIAGQAEESPGGFVRVNIDDDDTDGRADRADLDGVPGGDDDLVELRLRTLEDSAAGAKYRLVFSSPRIRVWQDREKTQPVLSDDTEFEGATETPVFVEAVGASPAEGEEEVVLKLALPGGNEIKRADRVKLTFVNVDLDIRHARVSSTPPGGELAQKDEDRDGLLLIVNDDDSDRNSVVDNTDERIDGPDDADDMATLELRRLDAGALESGTVHLKKVSGSGRVRVFDESGSVILAPDGAMSDDLFEALKAEGATYRVEGVEPGDALLSLAYERDSFILEDRVRLTVVKLDAAIRHAKAADPRETEVPNESERTEGLLLGLNDDDDDKNGVSDNADASVTGTPQQRLSDREDLATFALSRVEPATLTDGALFVWRRSGTGNVRMFDAADDSLLVDTTDITKLVSHNFLATLTAGDGAVRIEGVSPGEAVLAFQYVRGPSSVFDEIRVIVTRIDFDIRQAKAANSAETEVPDLAEGTTGLLLMVNDDDSDRNSVVDNTDERIDGPDDADDMATLRLRKLEPGALESGTVRLKKVSGSGRVRIFDESGSVILAPDGVGSDDLFKVLKEEGATYRVEGVDPGEVVLALELAQGESTLADTIKLNVLDVDLLIGAESETDTSTADDWVGANGHRIFNFVRVAGPPNTQIDVDLSFEHAPDPFDSTTLGEGSITILPALRRLNTGASGQASAGFEITGGQVSSFPEDVLVRAKFGNLVASEELMTVIQVELPEETDGRGSAPLNPAIVNSVEANVFGNLFGTTRRVPDPSNPQAHRPISDGPFALPPALDTSRKITPDVIEILWAREVNGQIIDSVQDPGLVTPARARDRKPDTVTGFRMADTSLNPKLQDNTMVRYFVGHSSSRRPEIPRIQLNNIGAIKAKVLQHQNRPVVLHIVQNPVQGPGLTPLQVQQMMVDVTTIWSQAGIGFTVQGPVIIHAGQPLNLVNPGAIIDSRRVTALAPTANAIDIYFVNTIGLTLGGTATGNTITPMQAFLTNSNPGVLIAGNSPGLGPNRLRELRRAIAHEIGHYLMNTNSHVADNLVWNLMLDGGGDIQNQSPLGDLRDITENQAKDSR